jgi:four helix bundle protein
MRDYRKLIAFQKADALVLAVYKWSDGLPADERYVLRSQIRRCAVSITANIVEGSARTGQAEYINHLNIAVGSAAELGYLVDLAGRIYPRVALPGKLLPAKTAEVIKILVGLIDSLRVRPKA